MSFMKSKNNMSQKKERNSNSELLRILAALFVIVLHYINFHAPRSGV